MYSGAELVIQATGTVFEPITEGAYVNLVVKYGLIRLISTKADLCEQIQNVDLKCPIEKGDLSITKSVEIPKEVPPVRYHATKLFDESFGRITQCECINKWLLLGNIHRFRRGHQR